MESGGFEQNGVTSGVWRAIDASANRAGEALRVLEDVVRFVLDDTHLTHLAKDLRHDLASILATEALRQRVFLRDVAGDVGAGVAAAAALPRSTAGDLLAANAARAAQALRSLQECAAVVAPEAAGGFEAIRYRLYALERAARGSLAANGRLAGIHLCVLVDGRADLGAFDRLLESLLEAGVRMVQIRDKGLPAAAVATRAQHAIAIARRRHPDGGAIVVVNDRADIAAAVNADGVHTGSDDLPTPLVRRVVGPGRLVGRTAHDIAEVRAAVAEGADYLGVGPCFPSPTKSFDAFAAAEFLRSVARETSLPAFAIGGITLERLAAVESLGFTRVAVASAVTGAADPAAAARGFIERLGDRDRPLPRVAPAPGEAP
jgi:thiamine-phosphate pyrophosphorylase